MDDWFRWIIGALVAALAVGYGAIIKRLFISHDRLEQSKANKESTDKRFEQTQLMINKHMDSCDRKDEKRDAKLDEIRGDISEIKTQLAVLASKKVDK